MANIPGVADMHSLIYVFCFFCNDNLELKSKIMLALLALRVDGGRKVSMDHVTDHPMFVLLDHEIKFL